jgi:hypothetical protein
MGANPICEKRLGFCDIAVAMLPVRLAYQSPAPIVLFSQNKSAISRTNQHQAATKRPG